MMKTNQTTPLFDLPLSWARTNTAEPVLDAVDLPLTSAEWIPLAEVPHNVSFEDVYEQQFNSRSDGVILQSVNVKLRDFLILRGWQAAAMGAEAILDLPWRGKRSVRELARRGRRHGAVREVENTPDHQTKLARLVHQTPSRQGVQLKYTERPNFDESTRLFVFESAEGRWLGAITISTNTATAAHMELIVRDASAPTGIMEALISAIAQQLAEEGLLQLSLGSVPSIPAAEHDAIFTAHRHPDELWLRSRFMFKLGYSFNFAYNAKGLWDFKNKFSPRWEPLYLVSSTRLSWSLVARMIQATGFLKLVRYHLGDLWSTLLRVRRGQSSAETFTLPLAKESKFNLRLQIEDVSGSFL